MCNIRYIVHLLENVYTTNVFLVIKEKIIIFNIY